MPDWISIERDRLFAEVARREALADEERKRREDVIIARWHSVESAIWGLSALAWFATAGMALAGVLLLLCA